MLGGKTKPKHALRSLTGANMFYIALGTQVCKMLSEGFMVPTPQCRVPSNSILQKPLSFSQDRVLQAILHIYTFHVLMDFIPPLEDLVLHSTQMFISSYCCTPCRSWGCYKYFILNFASKGSLNMCFCKPFFFSLSSLLFGAFPPGGGDKVRPLLCSARTEGFFFWMRQQKGLN